MGGTSFPRNCGSTLAAVLTESSTGAFPTSLTRAGRRGAKSVAVSFEPHPMRILRPDSGLRLITPTEEKLRLLQGIDRIETPSP